MSTIPASIEKLLLIFRTALPDVRIDDGPNNLQLEVVGGIERCVVVGYQLDGPGIEVDNNREGGGGDNRETYRINCMILVTSGDSDTVRLRGIAFDMYDRIAVGLRLEPFGRNVLRTRIDILDVNPQHTDNGPELALKFGVLIDAFDR